jgi:deoxyribose-phosphate aldolase
MPPPEPGALAGPAVDLPRCDLVSAREREGRSDDRRRQAQYPDAQFLCVNPNRVALCKSQIAGTPTTTAAIIGFPLGAATSAIKVPEAAAAVSAGAIEIDMVIDIGALLEDNYKKVVADISAVVAACPGSYVKCIIETCYLSDDKIVDASILTVVGGADCVKTSTGFGRAGAVAAHVKLMRAVVGPAFGVKAAGGIRTKEAAYEMIEAGASRIGASSTALFE